MQFTDLSLFYHSFANQNGSLSHFFFLSLSSYRCPRQKNVLLSFLVWMERRAKGIQTDVPPKFTRRFLNTGVVSTREIFSDTWNRAISRWWREGMENVARRWNRGRKIKAFSTLHENRSGGIEATGWFYLFTRIAKRERERERERVRGKRERKRISWFCTNRCSSPFLLVDQRVPVQSGRSKSGFT